MHCIAIQIQQNVKFLIFLNLQRKRALKFFIPNTQKDYRTLMQTKKHATLAVQMLHILSVWGCWTCMDLKKNSKNAASRVACHSYYLHVDMKSIKIITRVWIKLLSSWKEIFFTFAIKSTQSNDSCVMLLRISTIA